jgi:hypothetical protein
MSAKKQLPQNEVTVFLLTMLTTELTHNCQMTCLLLDLTTVTDPHNLVSKLSSYAERDPALFQPYRSRV